MISRIAKVVFCLFCAYMVVHYVELPEQFATAIPYLFWAMVVEAILNHINGGVTSAKIIERKKE